jgi:hypothetical protein
LQTINKPASGDDEEDDYYMDNVIAVTDKVDSEDKEDAPMNGIQYQMYNDNDSNYDEDQQLQYSDQYGEGNPDNTEEYKTNDNIDYAKTTYDEMYANEDAYLETQNASSYEEYEDYGDIPNNTSDYMEEENYDESYDDEEEIEELSVPKNATMGAYHLTSGNISFGSKELRFKCAICQLLPRMVLTAGYPGVYKEDGRYVYPGDQEQVCFKEVTEDDIEWPDAPEGRLDILFYCLPLVGSNYATLDLM